MANRPPERSSTAAALHAETTGLRKETGETSGPNSIRFVSEASQPKDIHISSASLYGPWELVK